MYTIKIDYVDGDSYQMRDEVDNLPVEWKSKVLARKALQCIKEHYQFILELESGSESYSTITIKHSNKVWFCYNYSQNRIKVELDDGTFHTLNTFWNGWPAMLTSAEIVIVPDDSDTEDKITVLNW